MLIMVVSLVAIVGIVAIVIGASKAGTATYNPVPMISSGNEIAENSGGQAAYLCRNQYVCYNMTGYNNTNTTGYCKYVKICGFA